MFGNQILSLYSTDARVIEYGIGRMAVICTFYCLCGMMDVMVGGLRGIGYSVLPMIVSLIGACGFRLVWLATIFKVPEFHTISVVYWSYPISWIMTLFVHVICFLWARKHMRSQMA